MSNTDATRDPEGSRGNVTAALYVIGVTCVVTAFGGAVIGNDSWPLAIFGAIFTVGGAIRGAIERRRP